MVESGVMMVLVPAIMKGLPIFRRQDARNDEGPVWHTQRKVPCCDMHHIVYANLFCIELPSREIIVMSKLAQ